MATRNLARTVVEGGRERHSKLDRKLRNRSQRRLRFDLEGDPLHRHRHPAGQRGFDDRLRPLERWIRRHVGRGWNHVFHEFCERFDRRSTKGWHLRDHLIGMVMASRHAKWGWPFFVDQRGVLRERPRR